MAATGFRTTSRAFALAVSLIVSLLGALPSQPLWQCRHEGTVQAAVLPQHRETCDMAQVAIKPCVMPCCAHFTTAHRASAAGISRAAVCSPRVVPHGPSSPLAICSQRSQGVPPAFVAATDFQAERNGLTKRRLPILVCWRGPPDSLNLVPEPLARCSSGLSPPLS